MVQHSKKMTDLALEGLNTGGIGLEVAPYFDAFLLKSQFNVLYTDYISNEEIIAKSALNPDVHNSEIPLIDFVWKPGDRFKHSCPDGVMFDYAVASHVMEHVPNPVGWLNEILEVVNVGGKIVLFLPDRHHTFDYFRNETQFCDLVNLWIEQPSVPTPLQVLDFMTNCFAHYADVKWGADGAPIDTKRPYTDVDAINTAVNVHVNGSYTDIHCTVYNPNTVKALFERIALHGLMNVSVSDIHVEHGEFLMILTKLGEPERMPPAKKVQMSGLPAAAHAMATKVSDSLDLAGVSRQIDELRQYVARLLRNEHTNKTDTK
jgi:hypothetical protein